jgi:hypothetical protein
LADEIKADRVAETPVRRFPISNGELMKCAEKNMKKKGVQAFPGFIIRTMQ